MYPQLGIRIKLLSTAAPTKRFNPMSMIFNKETPKELINNELLLNTTLK